MSDYMFILPKFIANSKNMLAHAEDVEMLNFVRRFQKSMHPKV